MTETTTRTWTDSEGTDLLEYNSRDKEPYYLPDQFYSSERLAELLKAIDEALAAEGKGCE